MAFDTIQDVVRTAQKSGFTWDVETLGFDRDQPMFSVSTADWGAKKPETSYFDVSGSMDKASLYGKKLVSELDPNRKMSSYEDFGKAFVDKLRDKKVVSGHNLFFDSGFLASTFKNRGPESKKIFAEMQQATMGYTNRDIAEMRLKKSKGLLDAEGIAQYDDLKYYYDEVKMGDYKVGNALKYGQNTQAYRSYIDYAKGQEKAGLATVFDTHSMTRMFAGLAQDAGLIQRPTKTGEGLPLAWEGKAGIGSKLELLAETIGIETSFTKEGKRIAHTELDVIFNQPVADVYGRGDVDKLYEHVKAIKSDKQGTSMTIDDLSPGGQKFIKGLKYIEENVKFESYGLEGSAGHIPGINLAEVNFQEAIKKAAFATAYEEPYIAGHGKFRTPKTVDMQNPDKVSDVLYDLSLKYERDKSEVKSLYDNYRTIDFQDTSAAGRLAAEEKMMERMSGDSGIVTMLKKGISDATGSTKTYDMSSHSRPPEVDFQSMLKSKTTRNIAIGGVALVAASTLFSTMSGGYNAPEPDRRISSNDDDYNTIEGLHPGDGVNMDIIRSMTDFGSGYQGPNPQLSPAYNKAEEEFRYNNMRASKIGASEEEIYKYMTEDSPELSEYVQASSSAGTALHEVVQAQEFQAGRAVDAETLVLNRQHGISGHIDIIRKDMGVGDIKTVNTGIFNSIRKSGKPKDMHRAQVQFYLGEMGADRGFIQYVNRDNPNQQKTYMVNFNEKEYSRLIAKVERARARAMEDIANNRLLKWRLPKTASFTTLMTADKNRESPEEQVQALGMKQQVFKEEMDYLKSTKRGMPTSGIAHQRIQAASQRRKDRREEAMVSTQGIGIQAYNNRNKHHIM